MLSSRISSDFFFILIIPIILTLTISFTNNNLNNQKIRLVEQIKIDITKKNSDEILDLNFFNSLKARIDTWKLIVKNSEKPIIGYGSQGDRYLAKEMPKHNSLASNSFIYAYASSGVIGVSLLLIFYIYLIKLVFKENFLKTKQNDENNIKSFYLTILIFLIIRSIFENSFSMWGIDFIIMVNCYLVLRNTHLKIY